MHLTEYLEEIHAAARVTRKESAYALAHDLFRCWKQGRTVFTCGNGGSAANASHLAQDLNKGTNPDGIGARMRTICLCDSVPKLTAWSNDVSYEAVFSAQLVDLGQQGDLLIAISGSGNSRNVLNAVDVAHDLEMRTWGVTGFDGGKLIGSAHRCIHVPCDHMGQVEVVHDALFHWLTDYLHECFRAHREGRLSELEAWVPPS